MGQKCFSWLALFGVVVAIILTLVTSFQLHRDNARQSAQLAITNTMSQYAAYWDSKDAQSFAGLFTANAVLELWAEGKQRFSTTGRAAIADYARHSHTGRLADRQTRHHLSPPVLIELDKNHAVSEHLVLITHQVGGQPIAEISGSGRYHVVWEKTDGDWRIAKRALYADNRPAVTVP